MAFLPTIGARPFEAERRLNGSPRPFGRTGASQPDRTAAKPGLLTVWQERRVKTVFPDP
jgi:hypothetical protein